MECPTCIQRTAFLSTLFFQSAFVAVLKFSICDFRFCHHFLLWSNKVFGAVAISTWLRNSDKLPWPFYILSDMCFSHSLSHDGRHVTHFGRFSLRHIFCLFFGQTACAKTRTMAATSHFGQFSLRHIFCLFLRQTACAKTRTMAATSHFGRFSLRHIFGDLFSDSWTPA